MISAVNQDKMRLNDKMTPEKKGTKSAGVTYLLE